MQAPHRNSMADAKGSTKRTMAMTTWNMKDSTIIEAVRCTSSPQVMCVYSFSGSPPYAMNWMVPDYTMLQSQYTDTACVGFSWAHSPLLSKADKPPSCSVQAYRDHIDIISLPSNEWILWYAMTLAWSLLQICFRISGSFSISGQFCPHNLPGCRRQMHGGRLTIAKLGNTNTI